MKQITGKELIKILERHGWDLQRKESSHFIYAKQGISVKISVPIHGNKPIKIGLLKHLLKQAGIKEDEI